MWLILLRKQKSKNQKQKKFSNKNCINCIKVIANTDYVSSSKSKGLSAETIMPSTTFDNSLIPALSYYGT